MCRIAPRFDHLEIKSNATATSRKEIMSEGTNSIATAWKTVSEMLGDRGVTTDDEPGLELQLKLNVVRASGIGDYEVRALAEEFPTFSILAGPGMSVVFHTSQSTVKKNEVFHAAEASSPEGAAPHVILVLRNKNTATVKSLMGEAASRGARLEIFSIQELQYNPARHYLVPKHTRVAKSSEPDILKQYRLQNRFQLPLILQGDAMARYLGLQHGDVVRVERRSPTAGTAVIYRVCS